MAEHSESKAIIDEIELYVQYGVQGDALGAMKLVKKYETSPLVLELFKLHYSNLPEAREEAVVKICLLMQHQGVHLFVVVTAQYNYLYAVSLEHLLYLGEYGKDLGKELLAHFGYTTQQEYLKDCPLAESLEEYPLESGSEAATCPVCGVVQGEMHLLGCVVEICPWCEGHLSGCNCRFERLNTDEIEDEEQLESFVDMLDEKGRIPFTEKQSPAYPGTSEGLDEREKK
jgi:hypothetical protein